jgi:hypothetical protein
LTEKDLPLMWMVKAMLHLLTGLENGPKLMGLVMQR